MKKIMILAIFCMWLVSCVNPLDKYKDSLEQVMGTLESNMASVAVVQDEISNIQDILADNPTFDPALMNVAQATQINDSLASINAELQAGNMDMLLSQASSNPEQIEPILDQIETYKTQTAAAIAALPPGDPKIAELSGALASAIDIAAYINLKMA